MVQSQQHAGTKRVPCPGHARNVFGRKIERRLPVIFPFPRAGEPAFGKMDDHQLAHPHLQQRAGGMPQCHRVEFAVRLAESKTSRFARLDFVQNAVVNVLEGRRDDMSKPVAVFAHHIHTGFQPGFLRGAQQRGGFGAKLPVARIECVEQKQVAEMKNSSVDFVEIQILPGPQGIRSPVVEKSAAPPAGLGHDVGVGGGRFSRGAQKSRVDFEFPAIPEDALTEGVFAHQTGGEKGKSNAQFGQVDQDVVGGPSSPLRLAANVGQLFRPGIHINQLHLVNNPVAAGKETVAGRGRFAFHSVLRRKRACAGC